MNPFRRSAEAEAFDAALRGAAPASGHEQLLRTVETLQAGAVESPRPAFADDLRSRLMAEAQEVLQPRPAVPVTTTPRGTRRRLAGVVAAAVTVAGGAGLVASSASALPGEALYPVKRGTEQVQKSLRLSDSARGTFELRQATKRLAEVEALAERDDTPQKVVDDALVDFEKVARSGTGRLLDAYEDDHDKATLQQVDRFVADTAPTLQDLAAGAPAQDTVVDRVQRLVDELTGTVDSTCPTCLSRESRRLADEVQRTVGGGSDARSDAPRERVVSRTPGERRSSDRHRPGARVAIPTTKVPSDGTARDGRADARPRPSARPAPSTSTSPTPTPGPRERARQRGEERRAERERRREEARTEREQRAEDRQADRERRQAEREARAEERRERARERGEERRRREDDRRRERQQRWNVWVPRG
ncbi:DUF5667 domain-containing protein [Aeromicrobium massiliense]|uniref:DUF5667 domain-containing protein n=1 Tax=Aeromicrobium massiliense TaxID=1464554 RepID=UPI00057855C3|nr:DUF5667 domain-containing protein [Aeromicrobium massiliense]